MSDIDDQLKELREIAYKTKETTERLETNWEMDRKDFSEFQNRLGHLEVEFKQLRDQLMLLPKRTSDKMEGIVDEIEQAAQGVKDAIIRKNKVVTEMNSGRIIKKSWWKFW